MHSTPSGSNFSYRLPFCFYISLLLHIVLKDTIKCETCRDKEKEKLCTVFIVILSMVRK